MERWVRPVVLAVYTFFWLLWAFVAAQRGWTHMSATLVVLVVWFFQRVGWHVWLPARDHERRAVTPGTIEAASAAPRHAASAAIDSVVAPPHAGPPPTQGVSRTLASTSSGRTQSASQGQRQPSPREVLWRAPVSRTIH